MYCKRLEYRAPNGSKVTDEDTLARVCKMPIPPAYEMYGFAHDKTVICKRSAVMHAAGSSTATIRVGAKCRDEGAAVGERLPLP